MEGPKRLSRLFSGDIPAIFQIFVGFSISPASRAEEPPLGFDNRLLFSF